MKSKKYSPDIYSILMGVEEDQGQSLQLFKFKSKKLKVVQSTTLICLKLILRLPPSLMKLEMFTAGLACLDKLRHVAVLLHILSTRKGPGVFLEMCTTMAI